MRKAVARDGRKVAFGCLRAEVLQQDRILKRDNSGVGRSCGGFAVEHPLELSIPEGSYRRRARPPIVTATSTSISSRSYGNDAVIDT